MPEGFKAFIFWIKGFLIDLVGLVGGVGGSDMPFCFCNATSYKLSICFFAVVKDSSSGPVNPFAIAVASKALASA